MLSPFSVLTEVSYHRDITPWSKLYLELPVTSSLCLSGPWQGKGEKGISNLSTSAPTALFSCCAHSFLCSTLPSAKWDLALPGLLFAVRVGWRAAFFKEKIWPSSISLLMFCFSNVLPSNVLVSQMEYLSSAILKSEFIFIGYRSCNSHAAHMTENYLCSCDPRVSFNAKKISVRNERRGLAR